MIDVLPDEEIAVLTRCFAHIGVGDQQVVHRATHLGLSTPTTDEQVRSLSLHLRLKLRGLQAETVSSFWEQNRHPCTIHSAFLPAYTLIPLGEAELAALFTDMSGWNRFRSLYPLSRGILEFSRIGFNVVRTQALVYMGRQVDWRSGHGEYWLYSYGTTTWEPAATYPAWIS